MDFKQYLLNYLSTVNDPTMKQVLDHIIKYAREQDPGFVRSYQWPVKTAEPSERQSANSNSTSSYEQFIPLHEFANDAIEAWKSSSKDSMQAAICCSLQALMPPDGEDGNDYFSDDEYLEYEVYDDEDYGDDGTN